MDVTCLRLAGVVQRLKDKYVLSQGASHRNAGLQPLLHTHVVREDEALERQSESSARSTAVLQQEHESCALARSADKRREVGKGLSLADTQTGRYVQLYSRRLLGASRSSRRTSAPLDPSSTSFHNAMMIDGFYL